METTLLLALLCLLAGAESLRCLDAGMARLYLELKCEEVKLEGYDCPSHYDCHRLLGLRHEECHYKDASYELGKTISDSEIDNPCIPTCNCGSSNNPNSNVSEFRCAQIDCPEFFGSSPLGPGCFRQYSVDKCCSTGTSCESTKKSDNPPPKCVYNGQEYQQGQRINVPRSTCKSCVCDERFNGTLDGPWCRDISCNLLLHNSIESIINCAPVFYGHDSCCPIDWRCPEPTDKVVERNKTGVIGIEQCTFGPLRLYKGDMLSTTQKCVTCTCEVPPFVTCIQTPHNECKSRRRRRDQGVRDPCATVRCRRKCDVVDGLARCVD